MRGYHSIFAELVLPWFCWSGGLGEGVAAAVAEDGGIKVHRLAVTGIPRSGPAAVLMEDYGISANCIVKAVKKMLA